MSVGILYFHLVAVISSSPPPSSQFPCSKYIIIIYSLVRTSRLDSFLCQYVLKIRSRNILVSIFLFHLLLLLFASTVSVRFSSLKPLYRVIKRVNSTALFSLQHTLLSVSHDLTSCAAAAAAAAAADNRQEDRSKDAYPSKKLASGLDFHPHTVSFLFLLYVYIRRRPLHTTGSSHTYLETMRKRSVLRCVH